MSGSSNALRDGRRAIRRHAWLMLALVLIATAALYAAAWSAHVRWDWPRRPQSWSAWAGPRKMAS